MPVLDQEPSLWPPELFERARASGADDEWFVLHTRPRMEKSLARFLRRQDIAHFLPQHEQRKRYQRRTVRAYLPLFPGYVFGRGDSEIESACRYRREVANLLRVNHQEQFEAELRAVRHLLESGRPVTREERLQPGMAAQIVSGPLAGLEGQVVRNSNGGVRFVLQVQFIQQAASVEVDGEVVRAV